MAITDLMNERYSLAARSAEKTDRLAPVGLHLEMARGRGVWGSGPVRQAVMDVVVRAWVGDLLAVKLRQSVRPGETPGPDGSLIKLGAALLTKQSAALAYALAGPGGGGRWSPDGPSPTPPTAPRSAPLLAIAGRRPTRSSANILAANRSWACPENPPSTSTSPSATSPSSTFIRIRAESSPALSHHRDKPAIGRSSVQTIPSQREADMPEPETVLYSREDAVARLVLNRPESRNALNHQMLDDLDAALQRAEDDPDVVVVVLSGRARPSAPATTSAGAITPRLPRKGIGPLPKSLRTFRDIERRYLRLWNCFQAHDRPGARAHASPRAAISRCCATYPWSPTTPSSGIRYHRPV